MLEGLLRLQFGLGRERAACQFSERDVAPGGLEGVGGAYVGSCLLMVKRTMPDLETCWWWGLIC